MSCFKIIDLARALHGYFKKKGNKKSKIIITRGNKEEKFEEELFRLDEIPKIVIRNGMYVIKKNFKIKKNEQVIGKYRVSNFNFMSQKKIIKILKNADILN